MKRKNMMTAVMAVVMALAMNMMVFAGEVGWTHDHKGWWYGTDEIGAQWYNDGWHWLDGNKDGVSECYYFGADGYVLVNTTTPDSYAVNGDGAWIVNGIVQTQGTLVNNNTTADTTQTHTNGDATLNSDNGGYNSRGCSNVAIEMMNNTREENVKFGEALVIDEGAQIGLPGRGDYSVLYANGFSIYYPTEGVTGYKFLAVSHVRSDLDGTHLFKYYVDGIWGEAAAQHLYDNGFAETRSGEYCYSLGTDCRIKVGAHTLQWGEGFSGSYIQLR